MPGFKEQALSLKPILPFGEEEEEEDVFAPVQIIKPSRGFKEQALSTRPVTSDATRSFKQAVSPATQPTGFKQQAMSLQTQAPDPVRKQKELEQNIEIDKARGFLGSMFSFLSSGEVGLGTLLAGEDLEKKKIVRDLIETGEIKVPEPFKQAVLSGEVTDIFVDEVAFSGLLDRTGANRLKIGMSVPKNPDKPKKRKMIFQTVDFTDKDMNALLKQKDATGKSRIGRVLEDTLQASVASLYGPKETNRLGEEKRPFRPREVFLPTQGVFGKAYASGTGAMRVKFPKGHPLRPAALAVGAFIDLTIPGPGELIMATRPIGQVARIFKGGKKALTGAEATSKGVKNAMGLFLDSPLGQKVVKKLWNKDMPRQVLRWFDVMPHEVRRLREEVMFGHSKIISEAAEFNKPMEKFAKSKMADMRKAGLPISLKEINRQNQAIFDWMIKQTGETQTAFRKALQEGKYPAELLTPELLSQITGVPLKKMKKFASIADERLLYEAAEYGKAKGIWSQKTVNHARKIIDQLEDFRLKQGVIPHAWKAPEGMEDLKYVMHPVTQPEAPTGGTFEQIRKRLGSQYKRTHALVKDSERMMYLDNKINDVWNYNFMDALSNQINDTVKVLGQRLGDEILELSPDTIKVVTRPGRMIEGEFVQSVFDREDILKQIGRGKNNLVIGGDRRLFRDFVKKGGVEGHGYYAPLGHLKLYVGDVIKRSDLNTAKLQKLLTPDEFKTVQRSLDTLSANIGKVSQDSADVVYGALDDLFSIGKFGKVVGISKNVPAYLVPNEALDFIRTIDKNFFNDAAMERTLRSLTKAQIPFMKWATVYNFPRFWAKYLITDLAQMMLTGDVPPLQVPFRISQGAMVKARNGAQVFTDATGRGYRFSRSYIDDVFKGLGIPKQTRRLTMGEANDVVSFQRQLWGGEGGELFGIPYNKFRGKGGVHHTRKAFGRKIHDVFSGMDDAVRYGTALQTVQDELWRVTKKGEQITKATFEQAARKGALKTFLAHYNYDDLPPWVKKGLRKAAPFISWWYHVVPDMLKNAFKLHKMHGIPRAWRTAQSIIGIPDTTLEAEYLTKSYKELKIKAGDKLVYVDMAIPYKVLDLSNPGEMFQQAFRLGGPAIGIILHSAGLQTYPTVKPYKGEKVDAPVWLGLIPRPALNKLIKPLGLSWRTIGETQETVLTMDKQRLDQMQDLLPWMIPFTTNLRPFKLRVTGMEDIREVHPGGQAKAARAPIESVSVTGHELMEFGPYLSEQDPARWLEQRSAELMRLNQEGIFRFGTGGDFEPTVDPWDYNENRDRAHELFRKLNSVYNGKEFEKWVRTNAERYAASAPTLAERFEVIDMTQ